jgi:hypothetical protein
MSTACRHCFPDGGGGGMTYMSCLMFGDEAKVDACIDRYASSRCQFFVAAPTVLRSPQHRVAHICRIERELGVVGGVSTWCERCGKCSVLSYALYLHSHRRQQQQKQQQTGPKGGAPAMTRLEYYARYERRGVLPRVHFFF